MRKVESAIIPEITKEKAQEILSQVIKSIELSYCFDAKQRECIQILHEYFIQEGIEFGFKIISKTNPSLDEALNSGNGVYKP